MPEQPRDMDELLRSVAAAAQSDMVIGTIATRHLSGMATSQRVLAATYMAQAQAFEMSLNAAKPGVSVIVRQTDHWYATNDPLHQFSGLVGITHEQGRRNR